MGIDRLITPSADLQHVQDAVSRALRDATAGRKGMVQLAGQLGGSASDVAVTGITEAGGPTALSMGAIGDGQFLRRAGTEIVGTTGCWGLTTVSLSSDFTVTSVGWADVTGLSATIVAVANERLLVCVAGQMVSHLGATTGQVTLSIDGTDIVSSSGDGLSAFVGPAVAYAARAAIGIAYVTDALAAGSRVIKVRAKRQASGDQNWLIYAPARMTIIRGDGS